MQLANFALPGNALFRCDGIDSDGSQTTSILDLICLDSGEIRLSSHNKGVTLECKHILGEDEFADFQGYCTRGRVDMHLSSWGSLLEQSTP